MEHLQVGDWISLRNGESGQVKWIGLRSTQLRIRDMGQVVAVPNNQVVQSIIMNYTEHIDSKSGERLPLDGLSREYSFEVPHLALKKGA